MASSDEVYFAFGNGRWRYDCKSCDATCCRGHGYLLNSGADAEVHPTVAALHVFIDRVPNRPKLLRVQNLAPGCFFLSGGGFCRVQQQLSYQAKPLLCRLFPFSNVRKIGNYTVVSPHLTLCPLSVADELSEQSAHPALLPLVREQQAVGTPVGYSNLECTAQLIGLEREIVDLTERLLPTADVSRYLRDQNEAAQGSGLVGRDASPTPTPEWYQNAAGFLGLKWGTDICSNAAIDRTLIATWPVIRAEVLFPLSPPHHETLTLDRLPHLLASLHLLASCAVAAGMTDVTFQTLFHLLNDQNPLIRLLAHSDCVMTWKDAARVDLSFWGVRNEYEAYIRIVQQLQRPRRMRTLGEIVTEGMAGVGADRTVFLKTVAARLSGRIRRADGIGRPRLFTNVKPRIQRAILRVSPATLLTEVGEARFGPSDRQFTPRTRATRSA